MKQIKQPLALLLTFLMALGVGVFAAAEETPDLPYIVSLWPATTTLNGKNSFTMSVDVHLPEGWTAEYQWQRSTTSGYVDISGATGPTYSLSPGDQEYPKRNKGFQPWWNYYCSYQCQITARAADGTVVELEGETSVLLEPTPFWKTVGSILRVLETVFTVVFAPIGVPLALLYVVLLHMFG